jgi:hypothetical protein
MATAARVVLLEPLVRLPQQVQQVARAVAAAVDGALVEERLLRVLVVARARLALAAKQSH